MAVEHDEIGIWSEVKLAIITEYASTYTKIMDAQRRDRIPSLRWFYIDGYAGSGHHVDSETGRAAELRKESGNRPDVFTYSEDCSTVLLSKVFPRADYGGYKRALCLLDPTTSISRGK